MRDGEKLRERVELRLDDRQVAALAVAVLLLLGGVFSLGLMVGKNLALRAPQPVAAGDLHALDDVQKSEPARPAAVKPAAAKPAREEPVREVHAATPVSIAPPQEKKAIVVDPPKAAAVVVRPPPEPALSPPPRELGAYTVQLGASPERAEVARLETRARAAGLKPYVVEAHLGAKGTWYRVRVGSFNDRDAANRYRKDVERELRVDAVVMPTR